MADKKCEHQKEQAEIHLPAKQSNGEGTGEGAGKDTMINQLHCILTLCRSRLLYRTCSRVLWLQGFAGCLQVAHSVLQKTYCAHVLAVNLWSSNLQNPETHALHCHMEFDVTVLAVTTCIALVSIDIAHGTK